MTPRKLRWYLVRWRYRRWCRTSGIPEPETLGVLVATGQADPELLGRQFGSWGPKVMAAGARPGQRARKSDLAADLMAFIRQYVVVTDAQLLVVALWVIHTYRRCEFVYSNPQ